MQAGRSHCQQQQPNTLQPITLLCNRCPPIGAEVEMMPLKCVKNTVFSAVNKDTTGVLSKEMSCERVGLSEPSRCLLLVPIWFVYVQ